MYALIEISNQMLEDSAFDHAGRHSGSSVAASRNGSVVAQWRVVKCGLKASART
jgi:hypothetical protein